jgi:hypothetical protein
MSETPPQRDSRGIVRHRRHHAAPACVRHRSRFARLATGLALSALSLLSGCGSSYRYPDEFLAAGNAGDHGVHAVNIAEAAADEVAIVINNNAGFGTHAGMFVGARMSDPAGNYWRERRDDPAWQRPTLRDYVAHQMVDGLRVQVFRFKLNLADIKIVDQRVADQGITVPLNCAAEVRDQIANVGVFKALKPTGWLSPSALAEQLLPLIEGPTAMGICTWGNGRLCRPAGNAVVTKPGT